MKRYFLGKRIKNSGSFLIEGLLSILILTGVVLGILKLSFSSDSLEYDYIQRLVISTEIYNYYSLCSILLSNKFFESRSQLNSHLNSLVTTSFSDVRNCNRGVSMKNFSGSISSDGYATQRDLWLSNFLFNTSLPLINLRVNVAFQEMGLGSTIRPLVTVYVCYTGLRRLDEHQYLFSSALPIANFPSVHVNGFNYENIVSCSLDSMPEVNCRFYYETDQPNSYTVDYTLPYRVDPS